MANLDKKLVAAREAARREAIVAADRPALEDLLSDKLIWTHANGRTDSKESYCASLGVFAAFLEMTSLHEDISVNGQVAVVKSEFAVQVQPKEGDIVSLRTFALGVWMVEGDGEVRLTHFQSGTMA